MKINKASMISTVPPNRVDSSRGVATGKIAADSKLQLCGWGGQSGYALEGCVDTGLLRPPQPHTSQLGTVYATKRRRRNGKR
ncbi:unnamed protein product, partial [Brenthis ino]